MQCSIRLARVRLMQCAPIYKFQLPFPVGHNPSTTSPSVTPGPPAVDKQQQQPQAGMPTCTAAGTYWWSSASFCSLFRIHADACSEQDEGCKCASICTEPRDQCTSRRDYPSLSPRALMCTLFALNQLVKMPRNFAAQPGHGPTSIHARRCQANRCWCQRTSKCRR